MVLAHEQVVTDHFFYSLISTQNIKDENITIINNYCVLHTHISTRKGR